MGRLVFCDTETTGRDDRFHDVWEAAFVERRPDGEYESVFYVPPRLKGAEPAALALSGYYEVTSRFDNGWVERPGDGWTNPAVAAKRIARLTAGATLVGVTPSFDAGMLAGLLRANGQSPAWHHRTLCVATMAYGHATARGLQVGLPWSTYDLSEVTGCPPPREHGHRAIVDARWARDWFDTLTAAGAEMAQVSLIGSAR